MIFSKLTARYIFPEHKNQSESAKKYEYSVIKYKKKWYVVHLIKLAIRIIIV